MTPGPSRICIATFAAFLFSPLVGAADLSPCAENTALEPSPIALTHSSASFSSFSSSTSSVSRLLITEVLPDPEGSDTEEWIEIGNLGDAAVQIAGLTLSTGTGSSKRNFIIPSDASGGVLLPGAYRSFRSIQTKLTLANAGSSVRLLSGAVLIDQLAYPAVPEGLSYGRDPSSNALRIFCVPTERAANADLPAGISILVQSGDLTAEEETSINLAAQALYPHALQGAQCFWKYPDGYTSEACNPPSHTLTAPGVHLVTLRARLTCGREENASITVRIGSAQNSSNAALLPSKDVMPPIAAQAPLRIAALFPGTSATPGWITVRNTSADPMSLHGYTIHGGVMPYHFAALPDLTMMPREERRFTLTSLRLVLGRAGEILLKNAEHIVTSSLAWADTGTVAIARQTFTSTPWVSATVVRAIDGSTFDIALHDIKDPDIPPSILSRWRSQELSDAPALRVRLIGVKAPSLYAHDGALFESGVQSLNFISDLLYNKKIELQFDTNIWDSDEVILAYARIPGSSQSVQSMLLRSGMVYAEREKDYSLREEFIALEEEARREGRGVWAHVPSRLTASSVYPL